MCELILNKSKIIIYVPRFTRQVGLRSFLAQADEHQNSSKVHENQTKIISLMPPAYYISIVLQLHKGREVLDGSIHVRDAVLPA